MVRRLGPLLLVLLLALAALIRTREVGRADALLAAEARARVTLADLQNACEELTRDGGARPDLARAATAAVQGLRPLDVDSDAVGYVTDGAYDYALAPQIQHESGSGRVVQGWILRAWPASFGVTGSREYELADDGVLWEGQNRYGRSGTSYGWKPSFPDPDIGQPHASWWRVQLPAHR